jgi:hypothetical protein
MLMTIKPVYLTLLTGLFKFTSSQAKPTCNALGVQCKRIFAIRNYRHLRIVKFERRGNFTGR